MQEIAWLLGHVSATDIVIVFHAWTLHHFMGSDFTLELRAGKLVMKMSKAKRPKRTR